ncbi:MAG: DUF1801 domain-containing protein [Saprospiraceae bacterium]
MKTLYTIHPHFQHFLDFKNGEIIQLYSGLRKFILNLSPKCNELIYNTHALTSVYTLSEKLSDAYCMIPIYSNHLNLGFNKGVLLDDPHLLLKGTGKFIRHIPISNETEYRNDKVRMIIMAAIDLASSEMSGKANPKERTISKIKGMPDPY